VTGDAAVDLKALWERRRHAFERFEQWEHVSRSSRERTPAQNFAVAGGLYELLPTTARQRPVVTSGVAELHRRLGVLRRVR
jgi:hypothetical protein